MIVVSHYFHLGFLQLRWINLFIDRRFWRRVFSITFNLTTNYVLRSCFAITFNLPSFVLSHSLHFASKLLAVNLNLLILALHLRAISTLNFSHSSRIFNDVFLLKRRQTWLRKCSWSTWLTGSVSYFSLIFICILLLFLSIDH